MPKKGDIIFDISRAEMRIAILKWECPYCDWGWSVSSTLSVWDALRRLTVESLNHIHISHKEFPDWDNARQ